MNIDTWIYLCCHMDLSKLLYDSLKLLHGFIVVVLCISCPLPSKTKLKFEPRFQIKVLSWMSQSSQCLGYVVPMAMFSLEIYSFPSINACNPHLLPESFTDIELRGEICPCRHCRQQCKIFASGVNFSIFTNFFVLLSI